MIVRESRGRYYEYIVRALVELLAKKGIISIDELNEIAERIYDEERGANIEISRILTENEKAEIIDFLLSNMKNMSDSEFIDLARDVYTKIHGEEPKPTGFVHAMYINAKLDEIKHILKNFNKLKRFKASELADIYHALIILGYENQEVLERLKMLIK